MDRDDTCEKCGVVVEIGQWPYCPHQPTVAYHPFIAFFDPHVAPREQWDDPKRGVYVDSLAKWNRVMHKNGWDLGSKYDRVPEHSGQRPNTKGLDRAFNEAARATHGYLGLGDVLRDDD